jgi:hypothetical protein
MLLYVSLLNHFWMASGLQIGFIGFASAISDGYLGRRLRFEIADSLL